MRNGRRTLSVPTTLEGHDALHMALRLVLPSSYGVRTSVRIESIVLTVANPWECR